ncbi:MAG: type VI secretion system Vgr family protein, partial [Longimicrobiales bacterium]
MVTVPFTQLNRPIRVDTELGPDVLLLTGFNGTEAVSRPFAFQLDLLSIHPDVDPAALLRKPVLVTVRLDNGEKRYVHGLCSRFSQGHQRDSLTSYRAEIVPWLWFLQLSRESRIYQNLTVPEIIEQVFQRLGYSDFDNRLRRSYLPRTYCVQYRETHFDFISRLAEEEGIFYFFEHTEEKHVLVLCDDNNVSEPGPAAETARFTMEDSRTQEVIWALEREHAVHIGMVTLSDYDPLQPTLDLERSEGEAEFEEVYDYPGRYTEPEAGEHLARIWLEAEEAERQLVRGEGNVRGLVPGYHFTLSEHYRRDLNTKYVVTQVQHLASSGQFRAWEADTPLDYRNTFTAIPHDVPYRPRRRTPRPLIHGSQSALVVGPPGEEIHADKYGRIKVQFYWDRDGQRDENSSCWIRVTTPWGGKGYGSVSIPRIGNEVLVAFEEGDPDRPIVIGSVYNADQMPPFELPGAGIQMGMKSRSSPGGGGNNEITMTDTKGKELLNINAQYDMKTTVGHDDTQSVTNDRKVTVDGTHTETIKKDASITISEGNLTLSVVDGTADINVKKAVGEKFDATQTTTVKKKITISSEEADVHVKAATEIKLEVGNS